MWRWLGCGCLVLVACGRLGFDEHDRASIGALDPDAGSVGDASNSMCARSKLFGNALATLEGGMLRVAPRANMANDGGCQALQATPFTAVGVCVEVVQVEPAPSGYTVLRTFEGPSPELEVTGGRLVLTEPYTTLDFGSAPYDPIAMRWWRLRPDVAADVTVGEYSSDGQQWIRLGDTGMSPPATIVPELVAGVGVEPAPGEAIFAHLGAP